MNNENPNWWWLSFCDAKKPAGSQFLSAALVPADTFADAITNAWVLGVNPGGDVNGRGPLPNKAIYDRYIGRRLSRSDVDELDKDMES